GRAGGGGGAGVAHRVVRGNARSDGVRPRFYPVLLRGLPLDREKAPPTPARAGGAARAGGIDAPMPPTKFGFGGALTRKEDDALVRGGGRYVADHAPDGALHAVVLRSPHAHARFRITDVAKARAMPGVALVATA